MHNSQNNRKYRIWGIAILIVVLLFLLASPSLFFAPTVTFIDTDLNKVSKNRVQVQTKTDFGDPNVMSSFPYKIGKWEGSGYNVTRYVRQLGADLILLREYMPSTFTQPLFLTIVQAKTESNIHAPNRCFLGQGYAIQEEGDDKVNMDETTWIEGSTLATIPFRRIVATKTSSDGQLTERRVTLYCYVKGNQYYSDTITMIQTEALAPLEGTYESSLIEQKDFLAQAIPLMFSPAQTETQWRPLALTLAGWGIIGFVILTLLIVVPIAIILYPQFRRKGQAR